MSFWEWTSFAITHAAVSGLLACLSLRGLYLFGRWFGTVEWLINYKRRRRFAAVLESIYGHPPVPAQRRRQTRAFFMQQRCDRLFYLIFDRINRDKVLSLFSIGNRCWFDDALAAGNGLYVALSHHGPHHVLSMLTAVQGYKTAGVRDPNEGPLRRYVQQRLERRWPQLKQLRWLYSDGFPREIYRCLRDGYVLGSALDVSRVRNNQQKAQAVSICGQQRTILTGPLRIALRCKAPVLQGFVVPGPGFRYRLEIVDRLIDPATAEDEESAIRRAVEKYAANVEAHARRYPFLVSRM